MFYKIFVVGYDDDGRVVVQRFDDRMMMNMHAQYYNDCGEFHKISIVLLSWLSMMEVLYDQIFFNIFSTDMDR